MTGVLLAAVSFVVSGPWASLASNAAVTLILVPPLVSVQVRAERIMTLQPADLAGLPDDAKNLLGAGKVMHARHAAEFYRSEVVEAASRWFVGAEQGVVVPGLTTHNLRLCLAQWISYRETGSIEAVDVDGPATEMLLQAAGRLVQSWLSYHHLAYDSVGVGTQARPRGKDSQVIRFYKTGRTFQVTGPAVMEGFAVLLRREEDTWRVANVESEIEPVPGAPPRGIGILGELE